MFLSRFPRRDALGTATSFSMQQDTARQNQPIGDRDAQLLADCHAMVSTRSIWLVECAKPVSGNQVDQAHSHAHKQQLADDVAGYGHRVAGTPAFTSLGLQNKRAIGGLLLAELTDDPSPVCDQLLLSLLSDLDGICAHIGNPALAVLLHEHPDGGLIEACSISLERIEEVCSECIRVGALPRLQEQEQFTDALMSLLMKTRRLLANVAGMTASSVEADVHYERLALAQSFVADIASLALNIVQETSFGTIGSPSAPRLWMFIDPLCSFSVRAMQQLQPFVAGGRLQLAIIPLAVIDHETNGRSTASALAMLSRPIDKMVTAWSRGDLGGAPIPEAAARLQANMAAAQAIRLEGTPTLIWRKTDGSEGRSDGLPSDLNAVLASLGG